MEKFLERLGEWLPALAEKLGTTVERLFPEIVQAVVGELVGVLVTSAVLLLAGVVGFFICLRLVHKYDKEESARAWTVIVLLFVFGFMGFGGAIGFFTHVSDGFAAYYSPEGYTVRVLLTHKKSN